MQVVTSVDLFWILNCFARSCKIYATTYFRLKWWNGVGYRLQAPVLESSENVRRNILLSVRTDWHPVLNENQERGLAVGGWLDGAVEWTRLYHGLRHKTYICATNRNCCMISSTLIAHFMTADHLQNMLIETFYGVRLSFPEKLSLDARAVDWFDLDSK